MMRQFICDNTNSPRLDVFLAQQIPTYSRTFWQNLVAQNQVFVNGSVAKKPGLPLKSGDAVSFELPQNTIAQPIISAQDLNLEIIYQNADFLAINKSAGLLTHATGNKAAHEVSLVSILNQTINDANVASTLHRAGLVHRLDKETSGVILVAKNVSSQFKLAKLFSSRTIEKTYLAIVQGHPPASGTIDAALGRNKFARHKRAVDGIGAQTAHTEFRVIEYFQTYSLVEVKIASGRTHQIRVHMTHLGFPVLGDFLYGKESNLIARQALHASKLEFALDGENFELTAPLPADMQQLLDKNKIVHL